MKKYLYLYSVLLVLTNCQFKQVKASKSTSFSNIISIKKARNLSIGSEIRIQGTVSVASGSFSSSTPFGYALQDNTAGIYIIDTIPHQRDEFKLGEIVEVTGILEVWNNLLVIKEPLALKKGQGKMISAIHVKTGSVDKSTEGIIIRTNGIIDSLISDLPYGYKVYINDGSGSLNVFINSSTDLLEAINQWSIKESLSVIGFSAQFGKEYEIEPRIKEDIQVIKLR